MTPTFRLPLSSYEREQEDISTRNCFDLDFASISSALRSTVYNVAARTMKEWQHPMQLIETEEVYRADGSDHLD